MADNTCHFGINSFFADNGLADTQSWLYFPADPAQMTAIVKRVFFDKGVRFIFSTRSKLPYILKADGSRFFGDGYEFKTGVDEFILEGTDHSRLIDNFSPGGVDEYCALSQLADLTFTHNSLCFLA